MPKFHIVVQIYKDFELDAVDENHATEQVKTLLEKINIKDRYNINIPKNLDKPKHKKKEKKNE